MKLITRILIVLLVVGLLAGCTQTPTTTTRTTTAPSTTKQPTGTTTAPPEEIRTFRYVTPDWIGDRSKAEPALKAVNEKLLTDGENIIFQWDSISWDTWEQKTNLMISTNEPFDMFIVMNDIVPLSAYYARGAIQPIGQYIEAYGQNLKPLIPEAYWQSAFINGDYQALPCNGYMSQAIYQRVTAYSYLFEKYGIAIPKNNDELMAALLQLQVKEPDKKVWVKANVADDGMNYLSRSYDTWPFAVYFEMIKVDQKGNVTAWLDSDEFKKNSDFLNQLMDKDLMPKDILTRMDRHEQINQGKVSWLFDSSYNINTLITNVPEAKVECVTLAPAKPLLECYGLTHANVVPVSSKQPDIGIRFFDWLYRDEANFRLLIYGIEGVNYKLTGKTIKAGNRDAQVYETVEFDYSNGLFWMIGNLNYKMYRSDVSPAQVAFDSPPTDKIEKGVAVGFTFDPSKVSTEFSNCQAEMAATVWPIKYGVVSYADGFQTMRNKMTAAGYDKVVAEWEKQFKEWQKAG